MKAFPRQQNINRFIWGNKALQKLPNSNICGIRFIALHFFGHETWSKKCFSFKKWCCNWYERADFESVGLCIDRGLPEVQFKDQIRLQYILRIVQIKYCTRRKAKISEITESWNTFWKWDKCLDLSQKHAQTFNTIMLLRIDSQVCRFIIYYI